MNRRINRLLAPLALVLVFALFGAPSAIGTGWVPTLAPSAFAQDDDVFVIGTLPSHCTRNNDGTITCVGQTLSDFCAQNYDMVYFGSCLDYGNGQGSGGGGGGGR